MDMSFELVSNVQGKDNVAMGPNHFVRQGFSYHPEIRTRGLLNLAKKAFGPSKFIHILYKFSCICNFAIFVQIFMKFPPKCRIMKLGMIFTIFGMFLLIFELGSGRYLAPNQA